MGNMPPGDTSQLPNMSYLPNMSSMGGEDGEIMEPEEEEIVEQPEDDGLRRGSSHICWLFIIVTIIVIKVSPFLC